MKFLLPLSLLAVLATGPALADCTVPTHSIKVPSAATATSRANTPAAVSATQDLEY